MLFPILWRPIINIWKIKIYREEKHVYDLSYISEENKTGFGTLNLGTSQCAQTENNFLWKIKDWICRIHSFTGHKIQLQTDFDILLGVWLVYSYDCFVKYVTGIVFSRRQGSKLVTKRNLNLRYKTFAIIPQFVNLFSLLK